MTLNKNICEIFLNLIHDFILYISQNKLIFVFFLFNRYSPVSDISDIIWELGGAIHLIFQNLRRRRMVLVNAFQGKKELDQFYLRGNGDHFQHHFQNCVFASSNNVIFLCLLQDLFMLHNCCYKFIALKMSIGRSIAIL